MGLDVSTSATGAAGVDGSLSTIRGKAGAADPYRRLHELGAGIARFLDTEKPDVAVFEGYSLGGLRGIAAARLAEVGGLARVLCFGRGIRVVDVPPSALKAYATGNGFATKEDMVDACLAAGGAPRNHDEADAFWLWKMAVDFYENPARQDAALAHYLTDGNPKKGRRRRG